MNNSVQSIYSNVSALNREFVRLLRQYPAQFGVADPTNRIARLGRRQRDWLAEVPFLLFSLAEEDHQLWRQLIESTDRFDLPLNSDGKSHEIAALAQAAMSFLWHLAKRDPFAARIISGADRNWCDLIAEVDCVALLAKVKLRNDLLEARRADNVDIWHKLLTVGVSVDRDTRGAARMSSLQCILTSTASAKGREWTAAACVSKSPAYQVADRTDNK